MALLGGAIHARAQAKVAAARPDHQQSRKLAAGQTDALYPGFHQTQKVNTRAANSPSLHSPSVRQPPPPPPIPSPFTGTYGAHPSIPFYLPLSIYVLFIIFHFCVIIHLAICYPLVS